ncbi:MAG: hypothetical protein ABIH76_00790 [Candidatus Bathyarchaeota archaeon]
MNWLETTSEEADAVLEWLANMDLLNQEGLDFTEEFWCYTWKDEPDHKCSNCEK